MKKKVRGHGGYHLLVCFLFDLTKHRTPAICHVNKKHLMCDCIRAAGLKAYCALRERGPAEPVMHHRGS